MTSVATGLASEEAGIGMSPPDATQLGFGWAFFVANCQLLVPKPELGNEVSTEERNPEPRPLARNPGMHEPIQEFVDSRGLVMPIDRQGGIIRGVKILGV